MVFLFTLLDFDEYQILGFFMFPHQEHVQFIGCVFYTPCPTCAFLILCSCIAHSHLLHTPLLPLSCLGLYLVSSSLACHVLLYALLLCVFKVFCLLFELLFLINLAPLMHHYPYSYFLFFPSFLLIHLSIRDKKGESILESVMECIVISYDSCAPSQEEKFYLVHIYRGRNFIGEMHIPRGRRHLL